MAFFYPGDLAIMRADGRIALQGRATEVLNIGGDKIAPAPIEERMEAELGVSGVCLFTMQNEDAEEEAHAVIESPHRSGRSAYRSRPTQGLRQL